MWVNNWVRAANFMHNASYRVSSKLFFLFFKASLFKMNHQSAFQSRQYNVYLPSQKMIIKKTDETDSNSILPNEEKKTVLVVS